MLPDETFDVVWPREETHVMLHSFDALNSIIDARFQIVDPDAWSSSFRKIQKRSAVTHWPIGPKKGAHSIPFAESNIAMPPCDAMLDDCIQIFYVQPLFRDGAI